MAIRRVALAAALIVAGCEDAPPGRKLASGVATGIAVQDGAVAFLLDARHADEAGVPEDLLVGDLWLDGGRVARAVSSQPGSYAFSERGELAALAEWRFREGEGELWTAARGRPPEQIAKIARAFAWSGDGSQLAFVGGDHVGVRGRQPLRIEAAQAIAWAPDGRTLAARTSAASGGKLFVIDVAKGRLVLRASGTSDFAFAPDGALAWLGAPPAKGGDRALRIDGREVARATAFAFSPDGKRVALLSTERRPGEASGDLFELARTPNARPELIAQRVSHFRYAPSGELLCLARFDLRARSGALTVSGRALAQRVQTFSVYGDRLLYLVQAPQKGDFRLELWAADLKGGSPPRKIDEGAYGWDVSPDRAMLFYKARCSGGPRSCSLFRLPLQGGPATLLADQVAGFDLSRDGSRILVQQPHRGAPRAVDLAVLPAAGAPPQRPPRLVESAEPGSRFADPGGRQVVYAIIAPGKSGVYVADVP